MAQSHVTRESHGHDSLPYLLHCNARPRSDTVLCGSGTLWYSGYRCWTRCWGQERQTHIRNDYSCESDSLIFLRLKGWSVIDLPPNGWLVSLKIALYQGLSVGLWCRQVKHSEAPVVRLALLSESPCCWVHSWPPSLPLWTLYLYAHHVISGVADDKG